MNLPQPSNLPQRARVAQRTGRVVDIASPAEVRRRWKRRFLWLLLLGGLVVVVLDFPDRSKEVALQVWQAVQDSYHRAFAPDHIVSRKPSTTAESPPIPAPVRELPVRRAQALPALPPPDLGSLSVWPHEVAIVGTPEVTTIREDEAAHEFVYQSPHYEFVANIRIGADAAREFSRVFEATRLLNVRLPLSFRPVPEGGASKFKALLYARYDDYQLAGGMPGSGGMYDLAQQALLVPITSLGAKVVGGRVQIDRGGRANSTLIHEITHQMMHPWLPRLPRWYAEGSAEYVAMLDFLHSRFTLSELDEQLARYLKRRGSGNQKPVIMRPSLLMSIDGGKWAQVLGTDQGAAAQHYVSALVLTYFFYHLEGKGDAASIISWLRAIEDGTDETKASADLLLHGQSPAQFDNVFSAMLEAKKVPVVIN